MNLLKDYDCKIFYHPSKGKMVANALNMKEPAMLALMMASN